MLREWRQLERPEGRGTRAYLPECNPQLPPHTNHSGIAIPNTSQPRCTARLELPSIGTTFKCLVLLTGATILLIKASSLQFGCIYSTPEGYCVH